MRAIADLFNVASQFVPIWLLVLLAVGLVAWLGPAWLHGVRIKQIKERVRRMVRASDAEQERLYAQAAKIAGTDPDLLINLVRELRRQVMPVYVERTFASMAASPTTASAAVRAQRETERPNPTGIRAGAAAVLADELLSRGKVVEAAEVIARARVVDPVDPLLDSLEARIASSRASVIATDGGLADE